MFSILEYVNQEKSEYASDRKKSLFCNIVQLGAGANGGYSLQSIAQAFSTFGVNGCYTIADPDVVETKNLRNQLFIPKDVGKTKASVLARRYRAAYNVEITAYDQGFVEDLDLLGKLFDNVDYTGSYYRNTLMLPVLLGCVDNQYSRQLMHKYFEQVENLLYIDVGVFAAWVPEDGRNIDQWSEEELMKHKESGYNGQVVAGLKLNGKTILDPVGLVYPDMLEEDDPITPSEASCSDVIVSEPQRIQTNRFAANVVSLYISELFESAGLSNSKTVFNVRKQTMRGTPAVPVCG